MKKTIIAFILLFIVLGVYAQAVIEVYPLDKKRSAEIYVRKGDNIKIEVSGKWSLWDKYEETDGEGHQFVANEYGNWGALLGKIGRNDPFYIGNGLEFTSEQDGIMYLFPNKDKYKMENQSGFLEVTVYGGTPQEAFVNTVLNNSTGITLDAKESYKVTDIYVESGESLEIYSFGEWSMWDGIYPEVSAEGHDFNAEGVSWGKLYCGIGSSDGQFNEMFPVGEHVVYKVNKSGIVSLFPYAGNYITDGKGVVDIYVIGGKKATSQVIEKINNDVRQEKELEVIKELNIIRNSAMLSSVDSFPVFSKTAYNHARYMVINDVFTRDEDPEKPYFTGKTLLERLKSLGYNDKSRELFCQTSSAKEAVALFTNTVYHRLRVLDPDLKYLGYGSYRDKDKIIHVFDLGYIKNTDKKNNWDVIFYPSNNITNVGTDWNGLENPDPFPVGTNKPLGIPITIIFNEKISKVYETSLIDENGYKVNSFIITPETDINNKKINAVVFVPKMPLDKNTKYVASISVGLGEDGDKKIYTWSFYTEK